MALRHISDVIRRALDPREIRQGIHPAAFYQSELPNIPTPKGWGWADGGLCPFHKDTRRGNFRVNLDTGAFRCFSCGAKGGDVIAFLRLRDGLTFPEALQRLSADWGPL
jgi:hypothetical protein